MKKTIMELIAIAAMTTSLAVLAPTEAGVVMAEVVTPPPTAIAEPLVYHGAELKPTHREQPVVMKPYTDQDVEALCKMVWGEALITHSDMEMSATVWCAINRLESGDPYFAGCHSLYDIVTQPGQFYGYDESNPVDPHIEWLVNDVLSLWEKEADGGRVAGRTLPAEYLYFIGDGRHNHFTTEFMGGVEWDWSYTNPYDD